MNAAMIGIASGLLIIGFVALFKRFDKATLYGLALSGIGFLYVGFTWSDTAFLVINSVQAVLFLFLAYYGTTRGFYVLAAGYFLHGLWDILYGFFPGPDLLPPDYNIFCSLLDFTIGCYLFIIARLAHMVKREAAVP